MALGTDDDIRRRLGGVPALLRLFDRDRDGTADPEQLVAAKEYADAMVYAKLGASHPGIQFDAPGPVPVLVRDIWARLVIGWMGEAFPGFTAAQRAPYGGMKKSACDELAALARNKDLQLPSGAPEPFSHPDTDVRAPATPWSDAAAGCDPDTGGSRSGF